MNRLSTALLFCLLAHAWSEDGANLSGEELARLLNDRFTFEVADPIEMGLFLSGIPVYAIGKYSAMNVGVSIYSEQIEKSIVVGKFDNITLAELVQQCSGVVPVIHVDEFGIILSDQIEQ